jgi:integrase
MRPKKPRLVDGIPLADNLYLDAYKRPGVYRYLRPDRSMKTFRAATVAEANAAAEEANSMRDQDIAAPRAVPQRHQFAFHVPLYIAYMEKINPKLKGKSEWKNNQYAMHQLAREFLLLNQITHETLRTWWDGLTHHQQKQRQAPFRRLFNWLMGQSLLPRLQFNPLTMADDVPRLLVKLKPLKARPPLTQIGYHKVLKAAGELGYEALQLAMGISLYTTLREGDICNLRWIEHVVDGELRVVVGKSEAQRGSARAARLSWKLAEHPHLKKLIDRAREVSLQNKRCPFVISHWPKRRVWNEKKEHLAHVTGDRLSRMFDEARKLAGVAGVVFHEIRGLSATLYKIAGYSTKEIQALMAHEDEATTLGYQDADALPYMPVTMRLEV